LSGSACPEYLLTGLQIYKNEQINYMFRMSHTLQIIIILNAKVQHLCGRSVVNHHRKSKLGLVVLKLRLDEPATSETPVYNVTASANLLFCKTYTKLHKKQGHEIHTLHPF
jgi:hypothetical protein